VPPAWCDQIPTPGGLYRYSEHCADRRLHDFEKIFIEGRQITGNRSCYDYHPSRPSKTVRAAVCRSIVPADSTAAPRNQRPVRENLQLPRLPNSKEKPAGWKRQA
jgi:hypothetical protein